MTLFGNTQMRSTWLGFSAILAWGTMPLFTEMARNVPPMLFMSIGFFVAFLAGMLLFYKHLPEYFSSWRMPLSHWANGIYGIFGFNILFILAMRNAPAVEALLIINLWPFIMMLLTVISEKRRLEWQHIAASMLGLCGVILVITSGSEVRFNADHLAGYSAALACGVIWATFSLINRKIGHQQPRFANSWFCLASFALCAVCHLMLEETHLPSPDDAGVLLLAGIAPMGLAFYAWDKGVRQGDIRLLSTLSYGEPLAALLLLILFGFAKLTIIVAVATGLLVAGAILSSRVKGA